MKWIVAASFAVEFIATDIEDMACESLRLPTVGPALAAPTMCDITTASNE